VSAAQRPIDDFLKSLIATIAQKVLTERGQCGVAKRYVPGQAAVILEVPKRRLYERSCPWTIPRQKLGKYISFTDADLRPIVGGRP
jgi:hypothetical protein